MIDSSRSRQEHPTTRLRVTVLGGVTLRRASGEAVVMPGQKAQALVGYLALQRGQLQQRDTLAALLWPEALHQRARHNLRQLLLVIRAVLPPAILRETGQTVALDVSALDIDAVEFERLVASGDPAARAHATALYQGDLLAGLGEQSAAYEDWLLSERERLRELALDALASLLAHHIASGAVETAIQTGVRLLALDPAQEATHRALMRLYARQGRRAAALRQYQTCVSVLQRELGADPEVDTRALYEQIVRHAHDVDAGRRADGAPAMSENTTPPGPSAGGPEPPATESPLVGRSPELTRLRKALDHARRGRGRIVAIVGEAGVGKSRLAAELVKSANDHEVRVVIGRCYESEQGLPLGPWIDALRAAGVVPDDPALSSLEPGWRAELARLFPEVRAPGLPPASDDARRLLESVARLLAAMASHQPLLVMLEDMHWADEMTSRLFAFLGHRITAHRILLAFTMREEELPDAAFVRRTLEELRRDSHADDVTLAPLSGEETARLVQSLSKVGTGDEVLRRLQVEVWRISEGNPFMIIETCRALAHVPGLGSPSLPLPARVRDVIAARLERLSNHARQVADVAAVIGRASDFGLLQQSSRLDERDAATATEELVRRRILHGVGEQLDFTHDRIREVVYAGLLSPRRRLLHRDVAAALESLPADAVAEHTERLAHHALRGDLPEKAVTYLRKASLRAVARSANRDAVAQLDQALETLRRLPETPATAELALDLRLDLRSALLPLAGIPRMLECLAEAEGIARRLGDRRRLGIALNLAVMPMLNAGRYDEALRSGREALAIGGALGDLSIEAPSLSALGMVHAARGELHRALEALERNVALLKGDLLYERLGQGAIPSVFARSYLADVLGQLGRFDAAIAYAEQAVEIAERVEHPFSLSFGLFDLGLALLRRGEIARAVPVLERSLDLCRTLDIAVLMPFAGAALAAAYARSGRSTDASVLVEPSLESLRASGLSRRPGLVELCAGTAYRLAGRFDEAVTHGRQTVAAMRRLGARGSEAEALLLQGDIARDAGAADADVHYRDALVLASELDMRPLLAHCHLGLGMLYVGSQAEHAREHLGVAATMFREMAMRFWLEQAESALR
jgi:DNA-binding SARP family transcriptional activator